MRHFSFFGARGGPTTIKNGKECPTLRELLDFFYLTFPVFFLFFIFLFSSDNLSVAPFNVIVVGSARLPWRTLKFWLPSTRFWKPFHFFFISTTCPISSNWQTANLVQKQYLTFESALEAWQPWYGNNQKLAATRAAVMRNLTACYFFCVLFVIKPRKLYSNMVQVDDYYVCRNWDAISRWKQSSWRWKWKQMLPDENLPKNFDRLRFIKINKKYFLFFSMIITK